MKRFRTVRPSPVIEGLLIVAISSLILMLIPSIRNAVRLFFIETYEGTRILLNEWNPNPFELTIILLLYCIYSKLDSIYGEMRLENLRKTLR